MRLRRNRRTSNGDADAVAPTAAALISMPIPVTFVSVDVQLKSTDVSGPRLYSDWAFDVTPSPVNPPPTAGPVQPSPPKYAYVALFAFPNAASVTVNGPAAPDVTLLEADWTIAFAPLLPPVS